ncbi:hypothetical protein [Mesorhizobium sp. M7A.F.Ca.US.008.03.1.1]|uniref:hypothetical protein n=1 Tax=Mesorhizobium sp. M7A.F.Ca.US.008.03.1.1 TaxID=2496742 RepID=UPI0013DF375A|nr:hypothetical protein [Mesorhizobium sp. M7A.F.Ca.US.008.03.1.1]
MGLPPASLIRFAEGALRYRGMETSFGVRNSPAILAAWKIVIKTRIGSPSVGLMVRTTRPSSSLMPQDQSLTAITFLAAICRSPEREVSAGYAVWSWSTAPSPDIATSRNAANAASIVKTAVTFRDIADARAPPSKQLSSMALHPFKPLTAWMMILLRAKYKRALMQ